MVQSVESTNILSMYSSQGVSATTSSTQAAGQKEEQTAKTQQYDTVELSAEAQAYAQQQSTAVVSETQAASEALKNTSKQVASAAESQTDTSEMVSSQENVSETSSSQTPVLSNLSEQELNDLVSDGTISKAELQAELARRESGKNAESTQDTSAAGNGSYAAGIAAYQQESTQVQSLLDYTA